MELRGSLSSIEFIKWRWTSAYDWFCLPLFTPSFFLFSFDWSHVLVSLLFCPKERKWDMVKWVQGSTRVYWTSLGADKAVTTHEWLPLGDHYQQFNALDIIGCRRSYYNPWVVTLGEHDQQFDVCMQMMIVAHFSYAYWFHFFWWRTNIPISLGVRLVDHTAHHAYVPIWCPHATTRKRVSN